MGWENYKPVCVSNFWNACRKHSQTVKLPQLNCWSRLNQNQEICRDNKTTDWIMNNNQLNDPISSFCIVKWILINIMILKSKIKYQFTSLFVTLRCLPLLWKTTKNVMIQMQIRDITQSQSITKKLAGKFTFSHRP